MLELIAFVSSKSVHPRAESVNATNHIPKLIYANNAKNYFNFLSPHGAVKHHFTSLKTDLIFLFCNFKPHQIIIIHYKSRISTAIRGL